MRRQDDGSSQGPSAQQKQTDASNANQNAPADIAAEIATLYPDSNRSKARREAQDPDPSQQNFDRRQDPADGESPEQAAVDASNANSNPPADINAEIAMLYPTGNGGKARRAPQDADPNQPATDAMNA